jgi:hypothetical protein
MSPMSMSPMSMPRTPRYFNSNFDLGSTPKITAKTKQQRYNLELRLK